MSAAIDEERRPSDCVTGTLIRVLNLVGKLGDFSEAQ
jgi:hypothetical protein